MGLVLPRRPHIIVAGCGALGSALARGLADKTFDVCVLDHDADAFQRLGADFSGFTDVGDATSADVLERNGVDETTMLLALTSRDNTNLLVAQLAKTIYGVGDVYVRLFNERKGRILEGTDIRVLCPRRLCEEEFSTMSGIDIPQGGLR